MIPWAKAPRVGFDHRPHALAPITALKRVSPCNGPATSSCTVALGLSGVLAPAKCQTSPQHCLPSCSIWYRHQHLPVQSAWPP